MTTITPETRAEAEKIRKEMLAGINHEDWEEQQIINLIATAIQSHKDHARNPVPNAVVLMFVLGWQGGTVHQVAKEFGVSTERIMNADFTEMEDLMRQAQQLRLVNERNKAEKLVEALELPEMDCGDTSCFFAKTKSGMRTNGGCRCVERYKLTVLSYLRSVNQALAKYRGDK